MIIVYFIMWTALSGCIITVGFGLIKKYRDKQENLYPSEPIHQSHNEIEKDLKWQDDYKQALKELGE